MKKTELFPSVQEALMACAIMLVLFLLLNIAAILS